jgi:hypothetical protein
MNSNYIHMFIRSWQLDATEGPARIRKRLQRCQLNIGRKYLLPGAQRKLGEFCFLSSHCMREVSAFNLAELVIGNMTFMP